MKLDILKLSRKSRELREFKDSWIYKEIIDRVNDKIKAQRTISDESSDINKIFRSQGAIKAFESVLRIPNEIGKNIKG